MVSYLNALELEPQAFVEAFYAAHEVAAEKAQVEYDAAITIQRFAI